MATDAFVERARALERSRGRRGNKERHEGSREKRQEGHTQREPPPVTIVVSGHPSIVVLNEIWRQAERVCRAPGNEFALL